MPKERRLEAAKYSFFCSALLWLYRCAGWGHKAMRNVTSSRMCVLWRGGQAPFAVALGLRWSQSSLFAWFVWWKNYHDNFPRNIGIRFSWRMGSYKRASFGGYRAGDHPLWGWASARNSEKFLVSDIMNYGYLSYYVLTFSNDERKKGLWKNEKFFHSPRSNLCQVKQ